MSKPLRVAICAIAHGREQHLRIDHSWELWGLNSSWSVYQNPEQVFARWFELHRRSYLRWEHQNGSDNAHFAWLRTLRTLPVYVQEPKEWPELMTARAFPFATIQALAPAFANYHACSIDWMIAYAITEGATDIQLVGVEQDHTAEPWGSRACVEFWSGFAVARGISVSSVDGSTFRLAQLTYTNVPYAIDPKWLTRGDTTNKRSTLAHLAKTLREEVDA